MDPLYALDATTAPSILASVEENAFKFFLEGGLKVLFFYRHQDWSIAPFGHRTRLVQTSVLLVLSRLFCNGSVFRLTQ